VWNRATIPPEKSYIFVDKDTKQYLDDNNIVLEWSRFGKHLQTPNIQSIDGVDLPKLRKRSKNPIKTLAEIISGTRGKRRGPKESFHANDWTRAAFDKAAKKHTTDSYVTAAITSVLEHELIIPQPTELFNLPTAEKRWHGAANDMTWEEIWGEILPTESVDLPVVRYELNGGEIVQHIESTVETIDDVVTNFQNQIDELIPTPTPWYENINVLTGGALVILILIAMWTS